MKPFMTVALSLLTFIQAAHAGAPAATVDAEATGADDALSPWEARELAMVVHAGVGTPYGFGASLEYTPVSWFSAEAGVGWGVTGVQLAIDGRFRVPIGHFGIALGGGISGSFAVGEGSETAALATGLWANGEVRLEYRFDSGIELGLEGGVTALTKCTGHASPQTDGYAFGPKLDCDPDEDTHAPLPSFGITVGYAF